MQLLFGKRTLQKAGKWILLTFLGAQLSLLARASDDPELLTVFRGSHGELTVGTAMETADAHYYDPAWFARIKDPSKDVYLNTISLMVDEKADIYITEDFDALVKVKITWTDKAGLEHSQDSVPFTVNYRKGQGTKYDARNSYIFDNARKVTVEIQRVDIVSADETRAMYLLKLENRMRVKRDYYFDPSAIEGDPMSESQGELWYTWTYDDTKGRTHLDIEWAWVDINAEERYKVSDVFNDELIFKNNSTRVTVPITYKLPAGMDSAHMYKIPLLYDGEGYLFYRMRPVQYAEDGNIYEGEWSGISYYEYNGHERDLNWQATTSYAEDGKRKSVVQYFDGSMRSRQTVTKDNVTNTTIVAEMMYDYQGRPAINILPAPTLNEVIGFAKNFNHFESSDYPKDIYDKLPDGKALCDTFTAILDSTSGSSMYYSSNNELVNEGFHEYIPSAYGYPYSETLYTPDGTGRIAAQGGVGPTFQLNKRSDPNSPSRETRYFYGGPDQKELDALFGTEVGKAEHYFKNMVRDPNGQYSVSYLDMQGRTIATALAGLQPASMDSVDFSPRYMTKNLLSGSNNVVKDRSIVSSTTILVAKRGIHEFHYELGPQSAEIQACNPEGATVCYDCYYDLEIRITGDCGGEPRIIRKDSISFANYDTSCSTGPAGISIDTTFDLLEGEYNIVKTLSISKRAQDWYRDSVFAIKNICKTLQQFYDQQYSVMIDSSDCAAEYNCDSCNAKLGNFEQFKANFLLQQGITDPNTPVDYLKEIEAAFNEAKKACDALCPEKQPLETRLKFIEQMMLDDMIPGRGQYALLDEDINGDGDMTDIIGLADGQPISQNDALNQNQFRYESNTDRKYNIFNPIGVTNSFRPFSAPRDVNGNISYYTGADGSIDMDLTPNPPVGDTREVFNQFASAFKDDWARNLLYYHPEYKLFKFASDHLTTSYEWDAELSNTDTWTKASTEGYISNLVLTDPFFTGSTGDVTPVGSSTSFRDQMTYYMTVNYRNTGKTLWQLAWIAGNCPDPVTNACLNTPSNLPPFTFPNDCESDQNKTWQVFRNMYLAEKENMISQYLQKAEQTTQTVDYADLKNRHYQRRMGATLDMQMGDINTSTVQGYVNGNNPGALTNYGEDQMAPLFEATCDGYIGLWKYKLSTCTELTSREDAEEIINQIVQGLKAVCINGSDEDHPLGSSTVRPGSGAQPASFEQVIKDIFTAKGIELSTFCHPYLIDFPLPYDKQPAVSDDVALLQQDSCLCARLTELQAEKAQNGYTGTLSQFLEYQHGVTISQGKLDTLIAGCSGSECKFYDPPFAVPAIFSCGANTQTCIDCEQYRQLKEEFKTQYPAISIIHENPQDSETQLNQNLMFEQFMNYRTGISKSWVEYLDFEKACAAYDSTWNCKQLDSIVAVYYETHSDTLYGAACQSSFASFFNSAFSTAFSFAQIQSLFMAHCGHLPDVCQAELTCPRFQEVVDSFYTRYGTIISVAGNCQSLFEDHFNDWFATDYTYAELQVLYNSLCGGALDVCSHFDCSKLQAVLDSWTGCHRADQLDEDCEGNWVTYFNGLMSTGLNALQIDSLYRACGIINLPCQPPVTCKMLGNLYTSYQNAGAAACTGSGLDSLSETFCDDCFVWFINDNLGTSYSMDQIKALFKKVCGTDLALCRYQLDCPRLTEYVKFYISNTFSDRGTFDCETAFVAGFNEYFNVSSPYTYEQVMALYQQYCGKVPVVCKKDEPVTCTQLQKVYNDFKQLYPQPSFYFGDTCQAAFTQYYNQYFGDTLTWNDLQVYYISMCGQSLDICASVPQDSCLQVQRFMADHDLQLNNVVMPKQACIDVYSRMFNRTFTSRVKYQWSDIERVFTGCGEMPPVCEDGAELNAARVSDARKVFYAYYYDGVPSKTDKVFTEFFNLYYKTSFTSYDQLDQWAKDNFGVNLNIIQEGAPAQVSQRLRVPMASIPPAPTNMPPRLCGLGTMLPTIVQTPEDPCAFVSQMALNAATEEYNNYVTRQLDNFDSTYQAKCLAVASQEVFTMRSELAEYHYTLYYYNRAGNLVKTVPPAGVNLSKMTEPTIDSWHAIVEAARVSGDAEPVVHTMATEYRYNSLNQVVAQVSPDGGLSHFWYDRLGRLVVSQNAKQAALDKYSYTRYDGLGRITEVGQLTADGITQSVTQDDGDLAQWFLSNGSTMEEITKTVYDIPAGICEDPHILCQQNLRNRVSYTYVKPTVSFEANGSPYQMATYYTYDIHGNVDTLLHHYNDGIMQAIAGNAFKRMAYKYDLVSGKVNEVIYQPGITDQFFHRYKYDAENKLTEVWTSPDSVFWERQAAYEYYKHGPLARTVIGELQVQGIDNTYTLQGWLKGVNSNSLIPDTDMGDDGGSNNSPFAKDVYSYSLNYFNSDYKAIKGGKYPFMDIASGLPQVGSDGVVTGVDLFNGNISSMLVNIPKLGAARLYGYRYDQLNRLKAMNTYTGVDPTINTFTPNVSAEYKERIKYDGNGNIINYFRNGNSTSLPMDNMKYLYTAGTNRLHSVYDSITTTSTYLEDIESGQANDNYEYDAIGNLVRDKAEGLYDNTDPGKDMIEWTMYGKIRKVTKIKAGITTVINYVYDPSGNRIGQVVNKAGVISTTWYVRDASGNTMAVYQKNAELNGDSLTQSELYLYGSSRVGVWRPERNVEKENWSVFDIESMTGTNGRREERWTRGDQQYELTNHLGNVLAAVSDRNYQFPDNLSHQFPTPVLYYEADVVSASDYYPFGMLMPGRQEGDKGRYGFNGKENDNEISGDGNQYDYGFRIYNPRLGRFLSVDPLTQEYPWYTPYQFAGNKPIYAVDLDGLEEQQAIAITEEAVGKSALRVAWKQGNGKVVQMVAKKGMTRTVTTAVVNFAKRGGLLGFIQTIFTSPSTSPQDAVGMDGYEKVVGTPDEYRFWDGWVGPGRRFPLPPTDPEKLPQWLADYWPEGISLRLPIQPNPSTDPAPDAVKEPGPARDPSDDEPERVYEQYALKARKNGLYPVMEWGKEDPVGYVRLKKGDVWKYGTTVNPTKRYTQKWLNNMALTKVTQETGSAAYVLIQEGIKIINYFIANGKLPAGNKGFK